MAIEIFKRAFRLCEEMLGGTFYILIIASIMIQFIK